MKVPNVVLNGVDLLKIPGGISDNIKSFCELLIAKYGDKIESINIVGSAASSDYLAGVSDVNLFVVFKELEITDLDIISLDAARVWRKFKITPRFISKRNLLTSIKYFPIDFLAMREAHVVIFGSDILGGLEIDNRDLLWQLRHEIKGFRMRLKQQYWRLKSFAKNLEQNIVSGINTILYLSKTIMYLSNGSYPSGNEETIKLMEKKYVVDPSFVSLILQIKNGSKKINRGDIDPFFKGLLDYLRKIDDISEKL